ncbi:MAG: isoprenyl transferase [Rhodobiaceae bacterium]|jgi:undecaprenyl diphosphate synthase|nr:isoprenyl transferase [Rhodobiaceae bacterium]MBT7279436.1 isoprenyl transferase [Rhodobiaceae bacterium]
MPEAVDPINIPTHVAIVMDGNGRWAQQRGLSRQEGHRKGAETLRQIVRDAGAEGIGHLTVFSFSTQNWGRPKPEVDFLMSLLQRYIESDLAELHSEGVRVRMIGRRAGLSDKICQLIDRAETLTADNTTMYLQIAFNYGAREEIADAASRLARRAAAGTLDAASITPEVLDAEMLTGGMPDPDLIIRTSGEYRLSNFLLWQSAYTEFYFTDTLWPDFDRAALQRAIEFYGKRDRRFGLLSEQVKEAD